VPSDKLNQADRMLIERCVQGPVSFTFEPNPKGTHAKLVRSTISGTRQKRLHELAILGYVSERVHGSIDPGAPPTTTTTFTVTAMGREAVGARLPVKPLVHFRALPTEEQMAEEGLE